MSVPDPCLIYPDTLLYPNTPLYPGGLCPPVIPDPDPCPGGGGEWVTFRDPFMPYERSSRRRSYAETT